MKITGVVKREGERRTMVSLGLCDSYAICTMDVSRWATYFNSLLVPISFILMFESNSLLLLFSSIPHTLSNVRVRLWPFYLILHNLIHSFIYNPVARESCIEFVLTPLPHNSYYARSTSTRLSLQYKGIRLHTDVTVRNKVEK